MGFRFSSGGNETDEVRVQTDKHQEAQGSLNMNKVGDQASGVTQTVGQLQRAMQLGYDSFESISTSSSAN